ncbi:UbiD family decarboxylase [Telmatospirillum siberiense]|uniref:UbiD family decarboxylase n=1 Tax=Telmatospirillum siberiense TaxID=382514 RepID=A0A2N3PWD8_9PROT|nr:UbiD family decarboxylase [Telmatospirillum siberiense]
MTGSLLGDLGQIVERLDEQGRLLRITSEVDPVHELAGIAAQLEAQPSALLFEKVKGHDIPVFVGLYWSRDLLAGLFDLPERGLPAFVSSSIDNWRKRPVPPVVKSTGPVLEVSEPTVDLTKLPIPVHALGDGGPYIDAGVVIAHDPETGVRNASIQRFMLVDRQTLAINIDAGRHLETYLAKAAEKGRALPFTLNIGVGPGLHFAAATPAEAAPIDTDELGIASEFEGAPVELVAGTCSPVEMVAKAMIALECEIVPGELHPEGPFAEVTGFYAKVDRRPLVRVLRVHHRRRPIFHTLLSGAEVWNSVGLLGEANVLALVQRQVPGVSDVYFSHGGCGFYHAIVQMRPVRKGWSKQAIMATFAAFPPLKMVTIVDEDVDIRNARDVEWAMTNRLDPVTGIVRIEDCFGHGLNPGFPDYLGCKVGFDCTRPFPYDQRDDRTSYKPVDLSRHLLLRRRNTGGA